MKFKAISLCLGLFLATALVCSPAALAEGTLAIVATAGQVESMSTLMGDLKEESVNVKVLAPAQLAQAKTENYVIVVITAQPEDVLWKNFAKELLQESDIKQISAKGGSKLILRRDLWKNGQEVLIFAGNTDEDAKNVRMKTKGQWWEIVASWFDIFTGGLKGY